MPRPPASSLTPTAASPRTLSLDPPRDAAEGLLVTTAIIGTGGIGSVIARQLASGGETLRLSSADHESARTLAAEIGCAAVVAVDNRDALQGADAVVLAVRFTALKGVNDEIAGSLAGKVVVVPSNPLSTDAHGNVSRVLPEGQSSGEVPAGWLPAGAPRQIGEALSDLQEAERIAPELTRSHYAARDLLQLSDLRPSPERRDFAERFACCHNSSPPAGG